MSRRLVQLTRYGGTAGLAAVVDLGGFVLMERAGVAVLGAAAVSFLVATVVNYVLTARFVFGHAPSRRGYGRFLLAATGGFVVNVGITMLALQLFGLPPAIAKTIGIGLAFFANFFFNAAFVFGPNTTGGRRQ